MNAKQLGYAVEEYKGVFRFTYKQEGIDIKIYINLNVAGYNARIDIRLPTAGCYCSLRERVNDAEEIATLLTKVKIIAYTLSSNDSSNTLSNDNNARRLHTSHD